jgi:hypothetical protein
MTKRKKVDEEVDIVMTKRKSVEQVNMGRHLD